MNVLKSHLRITIDTLLKGGATQREIERRTGVDRKTIRRYARAANSPGVATGSEAPSGQTPPPRPPAPAAKAPPAATPSACEPHRAWIESQVSLGRNAVQVEGSYYAALPAAPHSEVTVRILDREIEILDAEGQVLRRHAKSLRKGAFVIAGADRLFNPSRETARLLARAARIGPCTAALAREIFARLGRPGQRAIYGLASLPRRYARAEIEAVCARLLQAQCASYAAVRRALERKPPAAIPAAAPALTQCGPAIRDITEYQSFWETHSQTHPQEDTDGNVDH